MKTLNLLIALFVLAAFAVVANAQQVWVNNSANACPNGNCANCANFQNAGVSRTLVITHTRPQRVLIPANVCSNQQTMLCSTPAVALTPCNQPNLILAQISEPPPIAQPMPQVPMNPPALLQPTAAPPPVYVGQIPNAAAATPCNCTQTNAVPNCANAAANNACAARPRRGGGLAAAAAVVAIDVAAIIFHPFRHGSTTRTHTVTRNH
jgi:hypothetical protein